MRKAPGILRVALVADDEPLVRRLVSGVLTKLGWHVIEASDGVLALGLATGGRVDLLVTDLHMPAIDGWRLAETFRRRDPSIGVLMLSGDDSAEAAAQEAGYHFLAKPFDLDELRFIAEHIDHGSLAASLPIPQRRESSMSSSQ